ALSSGTVLLFSFRTCWRTNACTASQACLARRWSRVFIALMSLPSRGNGQARGAVPLARRLVAADLQHRRQMFGDESQDLLGVQRALTRPRRVRQHHGVEQRLGRQEFLV